MWGAHGTERSPIHLRLTFQWSLGGQLRKVVKDTNYKRARLMVACMTEKINSIEREKGIEGKGFRTGWAAEAEQDPSHFVF